MGENIRLQKGGKLRKGQSPLSDNGVHEKESD